jgi:ribosome maturation factor RimP
MIESEDINNLVLEKLAGSELFLAEVVVKPGNRVFVFLDGDRDVTIEDCADMSRHLNAMLSPEEDYELMVSSCGADQPIKLPRQFHKHMGRSLTVKLSDESTITGTLEEVKPEGIIIRPSKRKKQKKSDPEIPDQYSLTFDNIETAKVNLSFNK